MTIRESIIEELHRLSTLDCTVFLGENVINSKRIYGTLENVPLNKCIEMPIAENLIAGTAIGLSLAGFLPICIFQRMDFMLIAADAIINHACLYSKMTNHQVSCGVIFRTILASPLNEKFYVGHQHSKDFSYIFEPYMKVIKIPETSPKEAYTTAYKYATRGQPILIVESYESFNTLLIGEKGRRNECRRLKG